MPKSTFAGHPLHPRLVVLPAGLMPFAATMDALAAATGGRSFRDAACYGLAMGLAGGLAAGVAGAMDWVEMPRRTPLKRAANLHAALNLLVLAGTAANLWIRLRDREGRSPWPLALSGAAAAGVVVSGWYGTEMVYRHATRVRGVDPLADVPEARLWDHAYGRDAVDAAVRVGPAQAPPGEPWADDRGTRGDAPLAPGASSVG